MKKRIRFCLFLGLALGMSMIVSCSKDDNDLEEAIKPSQPSTPEPDEPDESNPNEEIKGTWELTSSNFGISSDIDSYNTMEFSDSNNLKVSWYDSNDGETPYTISNATYSIDEDVLTINWTNVTTDGVENPAFSEIYLQGEFSITDSSMSYDYSVFDTDGNKLSGPTSITFEKN